MDLLSITLFGKKWVACSQRVKMLAEVRMSKSMFTAGKKLFKFAYERDRPKLDS